MFKMKFGLGLALVMAALAIAVTPALALFTPAGGKGEAKAGEGTFTYNSATVKCASAKGIYTISSNGGQVKVGTITWENCKSSIGTEAKVVCNGLLMTQQTKEGTVSGKATGSVSEVCTVTVGGLCTITIGPQENSNLKSISLAKSGSNVVATVNIEGITATAAGSFCIGISEKPTHKATEKVTITLAGAGLE